MEQTKQSVVVVTTHRCVPIGRVGGVPPWPLARVALVDPSQVLVGGVSKAHKDF